MTRLQLIRAIYFVFVVLIVVRLGYWQLVDSDNLSAKAEDQRTLTRELPAPRGQILYSDNSVLAATKPTFSLFAQPQLIQQQPDSLVPTNTADKTYSEYVASQLAEVFEKQDRLQSTLSAIPETVDEHKQLVDTIRQSILDKLGKNLFWISLNRKVDYQTKTDIDKLNLTGVGADPSFERYYPEGSSSAHLLGFIGSDIYGDDTGYFGLEGFYNGQLKGKNGLLSQERDALGFPILIGNYISKDPQPGKTLVLNVDRTVQNITENYLKKGMEQFGAKSSSAIVMDPKTGAILALASYPNYDPANPEQYPTIDYKDSAIADSYEPGSTFKTLVMAAAINEGLITPDTQCDICAGPVAIDGYDIRTWDNKYFPNTNMDEVLIHSDNTGMVFVSRKLGIDKMYSYIKNFGFGDLTGVDLQDEESPDIRDKSQWKDIDLATASFGQGISATPLQVVRAVSAIANGGYLMEPHVVSKIVDGNHIFNIEPKVLGQPISQQAAKTVTQMMVDAVNLGEAKFARIKGYKIAGKTGTAQIPVAGHYDATKTIASFVGFAPANNPRFAILVKYDEPSSSIYGAETAAPTFFAIAKDLFTYYGIAPTEMDELNNP